MVNMDENTGLPDQDIGEVYDYATYIIGAMQCTAADDGGQSTREKVVKELVLRHVLPINPVSLEASKTGMNVTQATEKIKGWVCSGKRDLLQATGIDIWRGRDLVEDGRLIHTMGDLDYVKISDWLTFMYPRNDFPCGSFFECGIAIEHNIPIYLITDIPKRELKQSLVLGIEAVEGEFFANENEYFEFIDKKYKLHRKEK